MTVLLRDDFTGSGTLSGRTPDGVNGGAWVSDSWYAGAASNGVVSGGAVSSPGGSSWGAAAPLTGTPSDAYIEAQINIVAGNSVGLGLRRTPNTGGTSSGVFVEFGYADATHAYVNFSYNGTSVTGVTPAGTSAAAANPLSYVARVEVEGTALRAYVDGVLVRSATLTAAPGGTDAYIDAQFSTGAVGYVEVGTLGAPPPPPAFWQSFVGSHEVP